MADYGESASEYLLVPKYQQFAFEELKRIVFLVLRKKILEELKKYALCEFFLRECIEAMTDKEIIEDFAADPDASLLQHFDKPQIMEKLEEVFLRTMKTFALSKEELKSRSEFNFSNYDIEGFESVRAVFRVANALSEKGFTGFGFLPGKGVADLVAMKDGERWFIEVKTLVLQTKPQVFTLGGKTETLVVDKFQPKSRNIADYVEAVSRLLAGNHIQKARTQLLRTVKQLGSGKKMAAVAVNLFAAQFFLDCGNLAARLGGNRKDWQTNYLSDIDEIVFLTDGLHFF